MLHVEEFGQSSVVMQVIVQRYVLAFTWAHLASSGGEIPHNESSGVPVGAQFLSRNSLLAGHELAARTHTSAVSPSMLAAPASVRK